MIERIAMAWAPRSTTDWGVLGINLGLSLIRRGGPSPVFLPHHQAYVLGAEALALLQPYLDAQKEAEGQFPKLDGVSYELPYPLLAAMGNNLSVTANTFCSQQTFGIAFAEDTFFDQDAVNNASICRAVIAGCDWATDILKASGIENAVTWRQGVNPDNFPLRGERPARPFTVFIGGQLCYRKGQDIALAAFKAFRQRNPEVRLVIACQSAWPEWVAGIDIAGHMNSDIETVNDRLDIAGWLAANGIPADCFDAIDFTANHEMHHVYGMADVALLTNRCEAGTNQVATECMATGMPVILSANTGHLEHRTRHIRDRLVWLTEQNKPSPHPKYKGMDGWGETSVDEAVEALQAVYDDFNRFDASAREYRSHFCSDWAWARRADQLIDIMEAA